MLELFSRTEAMLHPDSKLTPLHIDDAVSSLSAILLNEEYYQLLMRGRIVIDQISILSPSYLIPFKAKAWLDLRERQKSGTHVDSRDIKKHRNDILRIAAQLPLEEKIELPISVKGDFAAFIDSMLEEQPDLKTLGLHNVKLESITDLLRETYCWQ